jgi:Ca2+-binding EF-hand superfamily protein
MGTCAHKNSTSHQHEEKEVKELLHACFEKFDKEGDGTLDIEEVRRMVACSYVKLGSKKPEESVD